MTTTKIADPHPGVEVSVIGDTAHRVRFKVENLGTPNIPRWKQEAYAGCSGELGAPVSWGRARATGVSLCTAAGCYPDGQHG
jgi:hypothetical protein